MKFQITNSKYIILMIYFLSIVAVSAADEYAPRVRAYVDKKSIFIGDRIKYTIEVKAGKGIVTEFPDLKDEKIGDFEIKDSDSLTRNGLIKKWYFITAYSPGKHIIPPLEIKYKNDKAAEWASKKTEPIMILINSVLPQGKMPDDIKDIKGVLSFREINWPLIISLLTAFFIILKLLIAYRRRKNALPVKLPHEAALEELGAIRSALAQGGSIKEYYVGISDCVRHYIEKTLGLRAPEMTTEEFLISVHDSKSLSPEHKDLLGGFMAACDMVKFAKYSPDRPETEAVFVTAKKFIEETKNVHI